MKIRSVPLHNPLLARASIWTLKHHDLIAGQIRFYVWSASATVLFLSVASFIPLIAALYIILFCGLFIMILLWSLILWRKSILLAIEDEKLRREAHRVMLTMISSRPDTIEKRHRWLGRRLSKKSHQ
jgi:hypothetical protein